MKRYLYITSFVILAITGTTLAQTQGISYQAVILNPDLQELPGVNANTGVLPNKNISLRFTIVNSSGVNDYQETHQVKTDAFGMVNLFIGSGNQESANNFEEIDWDGTNKNLQVDINFDGGSNYISLSNQRLTFVPYGAHKNITATGTLMVDGVATFKNNININGETTFDKDTKINGDLSVNGQADLVGSTTLQNDLTVNGMTNLNSNLNINNASATNLTGTLGVDGITSLNNQLTIEGQTQVNNSVVVTGATTLQDVLSVDGTTSLNNELTVEGQTKVNNSMVVTGATTLQDVFSVDGVATLSNDLSVSGNADVESELTVTGKSTLSNLIVKGDGSADGEHIALFENTGGGDADGIAIRIDKGTLGFKNRFITFYGEDDYIAGRVESFDLVGGDTFESFPIPDFANLFNVFDFDNVLTGGALPLLTFSGGSLPTASFSRGSSPDLDIDFSFTDGLDWDWDNGSLPGLTFNQGSLPTTDFSTGSFPTLNFDGFFNPTAGATASDEIGRVVGWGMRNGYPGYIPTSHWQIAAVPLVLAAKQLAMNQGVIYGSKGADYAEWLEKENLEEKFVFGEVVGVKGGKISKNTQDADQVLTISLAPIVLGNMPDENKKDHFEKVGFMGQVPVLVLGDVSVGDYIVASGYNDGYAKAISSANIKLEDIKGIIGKAWSASNGNKASLINVSVGLKTNEWVDIYSQQEERLEVLESKLNEFQALSERLNKLEAAVQQMSVN